ncbi:hypothetical protein DESUT3_21820 [Desulfuromonas versatilis]|uniref:Lipopolysaccharide-assembly n=1 Tax=Desulfuromonas versatilis TaxID=2802975 RepID=A0ABN6DYA8_9BACT|nr:LptE family protein [Desulfuromonas versatilis]BCR05113.1 hypothetical protein DESUT3_21820 [Desulfuromonas versatilis]
MIRFWLIVLGLALLLAAGGCGYHPPGRGEGQGALAAVGKLRIEPFVNPGSEPFLEVSFTNALVSEFSRRGGFRVVEALEEADAVLSGAVTSYRTDAISYDQDDNILEFRSSMSVNALLRRSADDRVLWKGLVSWAQEYPAGLEKNIQEDNEAAAIALISRRLAEELYFRLSDDF